MKITFDSNVWRLIATPDRFPNDPSIESFKKIRRAIIEGKIAHFISETVFTIESIKKIERKIEIGNKTAKIKSILQLNDRESIGVAFTIGPTEGLNFEDNPILQSHFNDAVELGFKITRLPRVSGLISAEVEQVRFIMTGEELKHYIDTVFKVSKKIELNNAGIYHIKQIGQRYNHDVWLDGIHSAPQSEIGNIAKAAAEWADGDSVAISIALNCDYFCTRDQAKSGGSNSVLSERNLRWLKHEYEFEIISPENLANLII
jgi:hypothetical protein